MQLIRPLLSNFYLNMFRVSLCPSSGEQDRVLPFMVLCTGCAGCGCVELGRKLCAQCTQLATQPAQSVQNTICGNTRSCSPDDGHNDARNMLRQKFDNKHLISCILLASLSSPYVHDARSQEPKIFTLFTAQQFPFQADCFIVLNYFFFNFLCIWLNLSYLTPSYDVTFQNTKEKLAITFTIGTHLFIISCWYIRIYIKFHSCRNVSYS